MRFTKVGNRYQISRLTGNQANILDVCLLDSETKDSQNQIEIIEWDLKDDKDKPRLTSKEEILSQVIVGLDSVNDLLKTNYNKQIIIICVSVIKKVI